MSSFQHDNERILSEKKNLHEYLDKEAARALPGECTAQRRSSEPEVDRDRKSSERRNSDVALYKTNQQLELQYTDWSCIRRINGLIKLNKKTIDCLEN